MIRQATLYDMAVEIVAGRAIAARSVPTMAPGMAGSAWHLTAGDRPWFVEITRELPDWSRESWSRVDRPELRWVVFVDDIPLGVDGALTPDDGTALPLVWEVTTR